MTLTILSSSAVRNAKNPGRNHSVSTIQSELDKLTSFTSSSPGGLTEKEERSRKLFAKNLSRDFVETISSPSQAQQLKKIHTFVFPEGERGWSRISGRQEYSAQELADRKFKVDVGGRTDFWALHPCEKKTKWRWYPLHGQNMRAFPADEAGMMISEAIASAGQGRRVDFMSEIEQKSDERRKLFVWEPTEVTPTVLTNSLWQRVNGDQKKEEGSHQLTDRTARFAELSLPIRSQRRQFPAADDIFSYLSADRPRLKLLKQYIPAEDFRKVILAISEEFSEKTLECAPSARLDPIKEMLQRTLSFGQEDGELRTKIARAVAWGLDDLLDGR